MQYRFRYKTSDRQDFRSRIPSSASAFPLTAGYALHYHEKGRCVFL